MGRIYAIRAIRKISGLGKICSALSVLPVFMLLVMMSPDVRAQAAELAAASKVAENLMNKDVTYAALFVASLSCILTGLLVRVMVQMFREFLTASVQQASAMAKVAAEFSELNMQLSTRPCQVMSKH
jgi:hypothetical protein